jgi:hypothetical protein
MWHKWTWMVVLEGLLLVVMAGFTLSSYLAQGGCGSPPEPSLTVQVPNGGERLPIGYRRVIQWSSTNVSGNVKIELSRNGGTS